MSRSFCCPAHPTLTYQVACDMLAVMSKIRAEKMNESSLTTKIAELEAELARAKQEITRLRRRINEGMSIIVQVGQAIALATDLNVAFRMAIEYFADFFRADLAGMFTLDADHCRLEMHYGLEQPIVEEIDLTPTGSAIAQAICDRSPVQVSDADQDARLPAFVKRERIRIFLVIPVLQGQHIIGGVVFCRRTSQVFDSDQVAFLHSLAQLYVHLLENVRLLKSEREQRRLAEAMYRLGIVLGATLDSDAVLDHLLEQMVSVIPYDAACVMLIEGRVVRISRARGYERFGVSSSHLSALEFQLSEMANLKHIFETQKSFAIADTWADPTWIRLPGLDYIRSWIGAPIIVDGQVAGILSLDSTEPGFYRTEHLRMLDAFATQAALALRNARLFEAEARRRQEAETLWTAAQALSKTLDLNRVFDLILHEGTGRGRPIPAALGAGHCALLGSGLVCNPVPG